MKHFFHNLFCILKYSLLFLVAVLLALVVMVGFFEQQVPKWLLARACQRISNDRLLVSVESASFRFSHGLRLRNVRVFDRKRHHMRKNEPVVPMLSASLVDLELNLRDIPWEREDLLRSVTLVELRYARLPEGYYIPDSVEYPGQPDFKEVNSPVEMELPVVHPFKVKLIRPEILGVAPRSVDIAAVGVTRSGFSARGIQLRWNDSDAVMLLDGEVELDLVDQMVHGEVRGHARQHNIRPMLVALDIMNSLQFIDAFTKVEPPVGAACRFDVNLRNNDLHLFLDLHPVGGRHHGVPLKKVDGTVDLRVFVRDTYQNARIVVGPLHADLADGTVLAGTLVYENTNDVPYVEFDVNSTAPIPNVLAIADCLNDGTLDCLVVTNTPPRTTLKGRMAVNRKYAAQNRLVGTIAFKEGKFFSIPMRDASVEYRVNGTDIVFTNAVARPPNGGLVTGGATLRIPDFKQERATYDLALKGNGVLLEDMAQVFSFDVGDKRGMLDAEVRLSGPLATNSIPRLVGSGHIVCRDGHLAQMRLFAGLTDYLAENVPGVAGLVNQSRGVLDFTLADGVFATTNLVVEGGVFSIRAEGKYDIVRDNLDFAAKLTFTRNESWLGKLATPITWPFGELSKMFFFFNVRGPLDKPTWSYNKNPLDRLPKGALSFELFRKLKNK